MTMDESPANHSIIQLPCALRLMPSALRFDKYNLTGEVGLVSAWNPGMVTRSLGGG